MSVICRTCGGRCFAPGTHKLCPTCKGYGYTADPDKDEETRSDEDDST